MLPFLPRSNLLTGRSPVAKRIWNLLLVFPLVTQAERPGTCFLAVPILGRRCGVPRACLGGCLWARTAQQQSGCACMKRGRLQRFPQSLSTLFSAPGASLAPGPPAAITTRSFLVPQLGSCSCCHQLLAPLWTVRHRTTLRPVELALGEVGTRLRSGGHREGWRRTRELLEKTAVGALLWRPRWLADGSVGPPRGRSLPNPAPGPQEAEAQRNKARASARASLTLCPPAITC